jgi:hypothetical protein
MVASIHSFFDELQKISGLREVLTTAKETALPVLRRNARPLGYAALGAGTILGAQRLGKDVLVGEQWRKQMREQG